MEVTEIKLEQLRNHPLNAKVFGELQTESAAPEFIESVKRHGVQVPLQVSPDRGDGSYMILSGHRRRQAAARAGLKSVPCIIREDAKSLELADLIWSESNLQREMTTEQRARFYEARKAVETALANGRMSDGGKGVTKCHTLPKRAKDAAAKAAGIDKRTAEKAVEVVHEIDELESRGQTEKAAELRQTLNTKSVAAAHRKAAGVVEPKPEPIAWQSAIDKTRKSLGVLFRDLDTLNDVRPSSQYKVVGGYCRSIEKALEAWK